MMVGHGLMLSAAVAAFADAELARLITVKHFKNFPDRSMFYPPQDMTVDAVLRQGITFSK
jgi:hypothetical protein